MRLGVLDRMKERARRDAATADAQADAIEATQGWLGSISAGFRGKKARKPDDRPRYRDPEDESR